MDFQNDNRFTISQHFTLLVNRFDLYNNSGTRIGFAEQKRFNLREKVTIWHDEARTQVLFSIKAEKVFDIHGKYWVLDEQDQIIGYLRKRFAESLLRSTWSVHATDDSVLYTAVERDPIIAIIRRLGAFIPLVGELLEQLPFNFDLRKDEAVVGQHRRTFGIRDKYELSINEELQQTDKRLLLALGLLLDILQQR